MKRTRTGQVGAGEVKKIKMLTGHEIPLDGDLLYILESLYREVTLKRELKATFEDMMQEIHHLVDEMDEDARKRYLIESLFLNTVTYENERLGAYMKKLTGGVDSGEAEGPDRGDGPDTHDTSDE
jgi:hypothetical protein